MQFRPGGHEIGVRGLNRASTRAVAAALRAPEPPVVAADAAILLLKPDANTKAVTKHLRICEVSSCRDTVLDSEIETLTNSLLLF